MSAQEILVLTVAGNVLSLVGCAVIISSYVASRRQRIASGHMRPAGSEHADVHRKAMFCMAATNVLSNIGGLVYISLGYSGNKVVCILQALHITYFNLSNWLWTVCIAANILLILKRKTCHPRWLPRVFCGISWAVPGIVVLPLIVTRDQNIVDLGPWCWIPAANPGLRYGVFYGWLLLTYFINLGILVAIIIMSLKRRRGRRMSEFSQEDSSDQQGKGSTGTPQLSVVRSSTLDEAENGGRADRPRMPSKSGVPRSARPRDPYRTLIWRYTSYVFVVLFCWIFGVVLRFGQISDTDFSNRTLSAFHTFFSISQMFWLSVVLVLASEVQKAADKFFANRAAADRERRPSAVPINADRRRSSASTVPINADRRRSSASTEVSVKLADLDAGGKSPAPQRPKTIKKMATLLEVPPADLLRPPPAERGDVPPSHD